jgi:hypothetical protein
MPLPLRCTAHCIGEGCVFCRSVRAVKIKRAAEHQASRSPACDEQAGGNDGSQRIATDATLAHCQCSI